MTQQRLFEADDPASYLAVLVAWDEGKERWELTHWHEMPGHAGVTVYQQFDGEDWQELLSSARFELTVFWDECRTGKPFASR